MYAVVFDASQLPFLKDPQVPVGFPKEAKSTPVKAPVAHVNVICAPDLPITFHSPSVPQVCGCMVPLPGCGGVEPAGVTCQDVGSCLRSGPGASWYLSHGFAAHVAARTANTSMLRIIITANTLSGCGFDSSK
jgi:hypothetical protein